jgi:hypothetical protein
MDEGKDGAIKIAQPHHTTRMYTSSSEGMKDQSFKSPEKTKTVEKHVKYKDTETSIKTTGGECIQSKVTSPSSHLSEKECKPGKPIAPQKPDIKPAAEYRAQSSVDQPPVNKAIPSEQECSQPHVMKGVPQPDSSGGKQKYNGRLIGGLLFLVASAIAVS